MVHVLLRLLLLLPLLGLSSAGWARSPHDDLLEQIVAMDARIASEAPSAELHLARGELHRLHQDWNAALADALRAQTLSREDARPVLLRARVYNDLAWYRTARMNVERYLAAQPASVEGLLLLADILAASGRPGDALESHDRAIALAEPPSPDQYLARAVLVRSLGPTRRELALAGLDEGIARLGPLVTLQLVAIELELELGRHGRALQRLDTSAVQSQRQERWLARRGQILEHAGRAAEALAAYRDALTAIDALKPRHRSTEAVRDLEQGVSARIRAFTGTP